MSCANAEGSVASAARFSERMILRVTTRVASDVEVARLEGMALDVLAPRLDQVGHQQREDVVGRDLVLEAHVVQAPARGIHGRFPELLGVHLAQTLVALELDLA